MDILMEVSVEEAIWDQIELSESYLVSGMYDEAKSVASSILKDLYCKGNIKDNQQRNDMLESAGMVVVQALKELDRTQDIFKELLEVFGSTSVIPVQVFLAGVCFQLSKGTSHETKELVEEFLSKWKYADNHQCYIPSSAESDAANTGGCNSVVGIDEYLEVVEIYVISILGVAMKDIDGAVSWVENAALPEDRRQDLLRRLQSVYSAKGPEPSLTNEYGTQHEAPEEVSGESLNAPPRSLSAGTNTAQSIIRLSQQRMGSIWWFRSITLKLGSTRVSISNGKFVMGSFFMVLLCYILQRKRTSLKENLKRRALSVRKGLVDLWELAFSYQVNPLAAIQPLPTASRGSR